MEERILKLNAAEKKPVTVLSFLTGCDRNDPAVFCARPRWEWLDAPRKRKAIAGWP